ncbi:MAG: hypothetical protein MJZ30_08310 [Paludibacteraceae bacterium]|nr:hypothetical protein [Paludibacteraceae bacterium]
MKKLFLGVAALLSALSMNAQAEENTAVETKEAKEVNQYKVDEGKFMMEIGYVPATAGSVNLPGGMLRGVYVLSEKIELKMGLNVGIVKDVQDNAKAGDEWVKNSERTATFAIEPGFNYCFEGTNRLEPYIGAELLFGITSTKEVHETQNQKHVVKNETGFNSFGVAGNAGFNFFVAKNLFIGAEVKLGVEMTTDKKITTEENGTTTKEDTNNHEVEFAPVAVPAIRIGWAF